jgi:hypothetical protein
MLFRNLVFRVSFVALFLVPVLLQTQDAGYSNTAKELAGDLSARLNLNGDQISNVINVLVDYQRNIIDNKQDQSEASANVNSTIEGLLNDEQKENWKSIQNEWWVVVNEKVKAFGSELKKESY